MGFSVGDQVNYGVHGICQVVALEKQRINGKLRLFLVVEPVGSQGSRFLVPTDNESAMAKLVPVLSRQEVLDLLKSPDIRQDAWIDDENQRKQRYIELIRGRDRAALLSMVRSLHRHREERGRQGRRLHQCDENFLRDAQHLLGREFSIALGVSETAVAELVKQAVE